MQGSRFKLQSPQKTFLLEKVLRASFVYTFAI